MARGELIGSEEELHAQVWARLAVQIEMKKRGLTYRDLTKKLGEVGIVENERNIANKIARGTFPAWLLLMCLRAMGVQSLDIASWKFEEWDDMGPI